MWTFCLSIHIILIYFKAIIALHLSKLPLYFFHLLYKAITIYYGNLYVLITCIRLPKTWPTLHRVFVVRQILCDWYQVFCPCNKCLATYILNFVSGKCRNSVQILRCRHVQKPKRKLATARWVYLLGSIWIRCRELVIHSW